MTDKTPATEAGRRLLAYVTSEVTLAEQSQPAWPAQWADDVLAIEAEARAEALREAADRVRALPPTNYVTFMCDGGSCIRHCHEYARAAVLAILTEQEP